MYKTRYYEFRQISGIYHLVFERRNLICLHPECIGYLREKYYVCRTILVYFHLL